VDIETGFREDDMKKAEKHNIFKTMLVILFVAITLSCGLMQPRPDIPDDALIGLDPDTMQWLGHLDLSDWTDDVPDGTLLSLFSGVLSASCSGRQEVYAYVTAGDQQVILGALSKQFGGNLPVRTLFFDTGGERFVVGYVDRGVELSTSDSLLYFRMDRPEPDTSQWMVAVKESEIKGRVFLVPIFKDEAARWDTVVFVGVQTQESLTRGVESNDSYYADEQIFNPPMLIDGLFLPVSIYRP